MLEKINGMIVDVDDDLHILEKVVTTKRKYTENFPEQRASTYAPIRTKVLEFVDKYKKCSKKKLVEFMNALSEDMGRKPSRGWINRNSSLFKMKNELGETTLYLSKKGQRILEKTRTLLENKQSKNIINEIIEENELSNYILFGNVFAKLNENKMSIDDIAEIIEYCNESVPATIFIDSYNDYLYESDGNYELNDKGEELFEEFCDQQYIIGNAGMNDIENKNVQFKGKDLLGDIIDENISIIQEAIIDFLIDFKKLNETSIINLIDSIIEEHNLTLNEDMSYSDIMHSLKDVIDKQDDIYMLTEESGKLGRIRGKVGELMPSKKGTHRSDSKQKALDTYKQSVGYNTAGGKTRDKLRDIRAKISYNYIPSKKDSVRRKAKSASAKSFRTRQGYKSDQED